MSCNTIHGKVDDLVLAIKFTLNKDYPIYTNLANFSKLIKDYFDNTDWCGFYLVEKDNNLYLGPFQGETATPFIEMGKGVCGTAAATKKSQLVPNAILTVVLIF
jgi:GAF domain-containing protein